MQIVNVQCTLRPLASTPPYCVIVRSIAIGETSVTKKKKRTLVEFDIYKKKNIVYFVFRNFCPPKYCF